MRHWPLRDARKLGKQHNILMQILKHSKPMDEPQHYAKGKKLVIKAHVSGLSVNEMLRTGKSIETEGR